MSTTVDEDREKARAQLKERTLRWGKELDKLLALVGHLIEAAQNEAMEGLGYKAHGIPDKLVKKLRDLAYVAKEITAAKVQYEKAEDQLAKNLTPDQEAEWIRRWIMALDSEPRKNFIWNLIKAHRRATKSAAPIPPLDAN